MSGVSVTLYGENAEHADEGPGHDLVRHVYSFWYSDFDHALILTTYGREERPSRRHKFRQTKWYGRSGYGSEFNGGEAIPFDQVVIGAFVEEVARAKFTAAIKVRCSP